MSQKQPVGMAVAKFDYKTSDSHELNITKGEKLTLLDDSQHWWQVMNAKGETGYVPSNFCKKSKQSIFSSLRNTLGRKKNKEPTQPVSCGASSVGTAPSSAGGRRSTGPSNNNTNQPVDLLPNNNINNDQHLHQRHDLISSSGHHNINQSGNINPSINNNLNNTTFCSSAGSLKSNGSSNKGMMNANNQKSGHSMSYNLGQQNPTQLPQYSMQKVSRYRQMKQVPSSEGHFNNISGNNNISPPSQQLMMLNVSNNQSLTQQSQIGSYNNGLANNSGQDHLFNNSNTSNNNSMKNSMNPIPNNRSMIGHDPTGNNPHGMELMQHPSGSLGMPPNQVCTAKFSYTPCQPDELNLNRGDRIKVLEKSSDGWWRGELINTNTSVLASGWFPSNYVTLEKMNNTFRSATDSLGRQLHTQQQNLINQSMSSSNQHHSSMPSVSGICGNSAGSLTGGIVGIGSGGDSATGSIDQRNHNHPQQQQQQHMNSINRRYSTVLTLFPFTKNQQEEMSFQANEILEVIDRPADDPDWWKCRNAYGDTGLVPTNYVKLLTTTNSNNNNINTPVVGNVGGGGVGGVFIPTSSPTNGQIIPTQHNINSIQFHQQQHQQHAQRSTSPQYPVNNNDLEKLRLSYNRMGLYHDRVWYWGAISRMECESLLMKNGFQGQFVVRDSESHPGDLTVTMHAKSKCRNFKVHVDESSGEFIIGEKVFSTIEALIQHYRTHPIYKTDIERLFLTDPFQLISNSSSASLLLSNVATSIPPTSSVPGPLLTNMSNINMSGFASNF